MLQIEYEVSIIGGGPAGLAAAVAAKKEGARRVLIIERDSSLGGILQQCIHPGFGLQYFNEELTGPEYAGRFTSEVEGLQVDTLLSSMVLEISPLSNEIVCVSSEKGLVRIASDSIVLAMGCRERTRAGIMLPGSRPSGIFTAGAAQRLINRQNKAVGKKVVILGSGDIGMIMARRLTLEGAQVTAVVELMGYLTGLARNKVQCLDDFNIPLMLSHTITRIVGTTRIEGLYIAAVDKNKKPILETETYLECDTLLLSVGLIPENELSRMAELAISRTTNGVTVNQYMQTSSPAVFACGNVVHVNDLVDNVTKESILAGTYAAKYARGGLPHPLKTIDVHAGENVSYICPQKLALPSLEDEVTLYFRVAQPARDVKIVAKTGGKVIYEKKTPVVSPGEMQQIGLPVSSICNDDLMIEIVTEVR